MVTSSAWFLQQGHLESDQQRVKPFRKQLQELYLRYREALPDTVATEMGNLLHRLTDWTSSQGHSATPYNFATDDHASFAALQRELEKYQRELYDEMKSVPPPENTIHIHSSVVGVINTGNVEKINVALDHVQVGGAPELAAALQKLTEAVLASELPASQKTKAVDHLSYIADQAALPADQRNASLSGTILEGFERIISTSSGLLSIWQSAKPLLTNLF